MQRVKKVGFKISFCTIVFICYAVRCINDGMLAFTSLEYSRFFGLLVVLFVYLSLPLGVIYALREKKVMLNRAVLCLIPFSFIFMLIVNTYQGYSGEWVTAFMVSCTFLLLSQNDKSETFKIVYWIIQITNIISLMFYLFAVLDVNIGYTIVPYYTGVTTVSYYKFGIFAILRQGFSQLRLCGVFNEPGGLGTICAFLFITTFPNSKTWEKIVLLATIAVTFSLAGYLLVFIYVGLYLIKKNKKFIILIPIIGYLFFIMPTIDFGNETLNYIARRFALTDKGLVGDNRYGSAFENFYQDFLTSNKVLFGYGYMYPMSLNVSTYKALIIQFGIVGFIYYIGLIAFMAIKYAAKDKDCILLLILFLISIYQRPLAVSSLYGFVILFGGIDYIKVQKQKTAKAEDMGKVPT